MSQEKIYLELSPEIQEWLAENHLSIGNLLRENNIATEITYGVVPYQMENGTRTKDIATIIIAGSAAVISLGFAISQVLESVYSRPVLVEIFEIEELRDSDGEVLVDEYGNPLLKPVQRYELIEPRQEEKTKEFGITFDLKNGLVIKVKTHSGDINHQ